MKATEDTGEIINVLVFPAGSEVGLEVNRSLKYERTIRLIGASSVRDHGRFEFHSYVDGLPFASAGNFIEELRKVIVSHGIDIVYPTMDSVIAVLKNAESQLGCKVVSSSAAFVNTCLRKRATYSALRGGSILVPEVYARPDRVTRYPVFLKPDIGYGTRNTLKAGIREEVEMWIEKNPDGLILEYLPGKEFTVDCFTDFKGNLRFVGPRVRSRISNGISVHTFEAAAIREQSKQIAEEINSKMRPDGAWFFQLKENANGDLVLLEVASRLGGSSALYRAKGINFALLSVYNCLKKEVNIVENSFELELDRALSNAYKVNISFKHAYIDLDDCLILNGKVNTDLVKLIYQFHNAGIRTYLVTRHASDVETTLKKFRLSEIFDEIIHITGDEQKGEFIVHNDSIFIDDSFREVSSVFRSRGIPVFRPDAIECLMNVL